MLVKQLAYDIVYTDVMASIVMPARILEQRFLQAGYSDLQAAELAEEWADRFSSELDKQLNDWDSLGIPPPLVPSKLDGSYVTFHSQRYTTHLCQVGEPLLPRSFYRVLQMVRSTTPKTFLAACAIYLYFAGCDPIYISDSTGDEGVDLVAKLSTHPMNTLVFHLQSKTATAKVPRPTIAADYGKFRGAVLRKSQTIVSYLGAVGLDGSHQGVGRLYVFAANSEYEQSATAYALDETLLILNPRQIAYVVARRTAPEVFAHAMVSLEPMCRKDLTNNLSPVIRRLFEDG